MQSLRSRPSQAPRKAKLAKSGPGPTSRDSRKTRVDDKIKKRMSMRYANISSPTDLTRVPAMPSLSGLVTPGQKLTPKEDDEDVRDRSSAKEDTRIKADEKKMLSADDFDPDAFLKLKLANSTEAELRDLQSSLRTSKDDTAAELQRSVFKNYAEFVLISKEISVLENEMLELKDLLSEYKSMPSSLHIPDPTSTSTSTLSTYKRSSVADLRILYFNQMQALHTAIEGAAKFVPTTPGRHVVAEMEDVLSLNAATYKVVGKVKFVILDDAVLVARRRRRNAGGEASGSTVNEGKLVAERCWSLNEMLVLDTKDSASMTNVFKIRHGKETHVYRTESPQDKKTLLTQFRQVADELAAKKRKEREGEHERRKSLWQGGMGSGGGDRGSTIPPVPEWLADLARRGGDIPGMGSDAKEKAENDSRWVGEWSDNLTVAIALREWEKAVELVEQGQAKLSTVPPLEAKLMPLTSQLTSSLLASLSLVSNRKSNVIKLISLLCRLKAGAAARTTFLDMRTEVIRGLMRKIRFEGHIGAYIGDLAMVYFTGIKHTADWYLASFKENEVASTFIQWARQQLENYADMFRKQVFTKDVDPQVVEEALAITYSQSKKLLQEFGLDFRYILNQLLVPSPKDPTKPTLGFSLQAHRMSKAPNTSTLAKTKKADNPPPSQPQTQPNPDFLQTEPPLFKMSAPPPSRKRSPAPPPLPSTQPPPPPAIPMAGSLYPAPSAAKTNGRASPSTDGDAISEPDTGYTIPSQYSNVTTAYTAAPTPSRPQLGSTPYGPRSRAPVSAVPRSAAVPPVSAPIPSMPLASPLPRRAKSPPLSANPLRVGRLREEAGEERLKERERPPRSLRSPAPPPRSANRPGSAAGLRSPPVAVPQHEGMI